MPIDTKWDNPNWNLGGLFTVPSAIYEFSKVDLRKNSLHDNLIAILFGCLKCLPLIGMATYLSQKAMRVIQDFVPGSTTAKVANITPPKTREPSPITFNDRARKLEKLISTYNDKQRESPVMASWGLLQGIDEVLKNCDDSQRKELLRPLIARASYMSGGVTFLLDHLFRIDKVIFNDVIKAPLEAESCLNNEAWVTWVHVNAPNLIGEALRHHDDPMSFILVADPTFTKLPFERQYDRLPESSKGLLWLYVKDKGDLLKELVNKSQTASPLKFQDRTIAFSTNIVSEIFDSPNECFDILQPYINQQLLTPLVNNIHHNCCCWAIKGIALRTQRFQNFLANSISFYSNDPDSNRQIANWATFTRIAGDKLLQSIQKNHPDWIEKAFSSHFENTSPLDLLHTAEDVYKLSPELFRKHALEMATRKNPAPINLVAIALRPDQERSWYSKNDLALSWLMKTDSRLFIQLMGMAEKLEITPEIKHSFNAFFKANVDAIVLDPENLPTSKELEQFYLNLAQYPDIKAPALHISSTKPEKLTAIGQLLGDFAKTGNPELKVVFKDPAFDLSQTLVKTEAFREEVAIKEGKISVHLSLLERFGITSNVIKEGTKAEAETLLDFIYKGHCPLKIAKEMSLLLKNHKPLAPLSQEKYAKLNEDQKKQLGKIIFQEGDNEDPFYIHKAALANHKTLSNLVFPTVFQQEDYKLNSEEINLSKNQFLKLLAGIYEEPLDVKKMGMDELGSLIAASKFFGLDRIKNRLNREYEERILANPSIIKNSSFEERLALIDWMKDSGKYCPYSLYNERRESYWLDDLKPEEIKQILTAIFSDAKFDTPATETTNNRRNHIIDQASPIIGKLELQEKTDLLARIAQAGDIELFESLRESWDIETVKLDLRNISGVNLERRKEIYTSIANIISEYAKFDYYQMDAFLSQLVQDIELQAAKDLLKALAEEEDKKRFNLIWKHPHDLSLFMDMPKLKKASQIDEGMIVKQLMLLCRQDEKYKNMYQTLANAFPQYSQA